MKTGTGNNLKLGLFVTIGLAALLAGLFLIGSRHQMFISTFRVTGQFKNVAGLQAGNNVRLSGVNIGTVDVVTIVSDTTVQVELVIDEVKREFIRQDAIASIGNEGLMGNKVININPGTAGMPDIKDGGVITAALPIDVDDILNSMNTSITNTAAITSDLSTIVASIRSGEGTIGKLLMDQRLAQEIDVSLQKMKTSITNTAEITYDLSTILTSIRDGEGTIGKLLMDQKLAQEIDVSIENLKHSSNGLRGIIDQAQSGMTQNLDTTAANLKVASEKMKHLTIKANRSWLLWGFGKDKEARKAKEEKKKAEKARKSGNEDGKDKQPAPDTDTDTEK